MLTELKPKMLLFLPESYQALFGNFVKEYHLVVGQLTSFMYKTMCPAMINSTDVSSSFINLYKMLINGLFIVDTSTSIGLQLGF